MLARRRLVLYAITAGEIRDAAERATTPPRATPGARGRRQRAESEQRGIVTKASLAIASRSASEGAVPYLPVAAMVSSYRGP